MFMLHKICNFRFSCFICVTQHDIVPGALPALIIATTWVSVNAFPCSRPIYYSVTVTSVFLQSCNKLVDTNRLQMSCLQIKACRLVF